MESLKLVRSPVGAIGTLALVAGALVLLGGITAGLASRNPELTAQVGPAEPLNWGGLLAGAAQITAAGELLDFCVVLSWIFVREFTDGTVTGPFALSVILSRIALAKYIVYSAWALVVSLIRTLGILGLGVLFGYGGAIALVIIAQIGSLAGTGGWMPLAAPALWAMSAGTAVNTVQLFLTTALGVIFGVLTCATWA